MPSLHLDDALLLFLALFALYSPIAALSSYLPIVEGYTSDEQRKLAWGLFTNVSVLMLAALWIGEPLLELLGISTAALSATGGIALLLAAVPMMTGRTAPPPKAVAEAAVEPPAGPGGTGPGAEPGPRAETGSGPGPGRAGAGPPAPWRSIVFTPLTFPLTFGGTTFGFFVAYRAEAPGWWAAVGLTVAGFGYAAVTGLTLYAAGHVTRRVSDSTGAVLEKVAGILLVAIAMMLLASGGTRLVLDVLN
ncbi:MarC family protein [Kitasatospora sp. NPDC058201]|uniref:MarC family protein n=1 Tax=unclassified Kitasatospora TaxID=2633591 RepID=UPI00365D9B19